MANRDLVVRFIGDERDLTRALKASERNVVTFQGRMQTVGRDFGRSFLPAAAGAAAGAAIVAGLRRSVEQAVALNEEVNKSREVFGDASGEVESWSRSTARSMGIARSEALKATGTFGNLFRVIDLAPEKSAEMSRALVQLAADLASFNNASPEDVLLALRSGLIGEAEPLRRYGVLLSEARVQQVAMAQTGKNNVKALTDQEKALARYQIIMEDTVTAQGDFARTSDGLANQSRTLRANFNDLAGNVGQVLIPVLTDATEAANLLFIALDKFRGVDFTPGFDFPDPPGWLRAFALAPVSPLAAGALAVSRALEDDTEAFSSRGGPQASAGRRIAARLAKEEAEAKKATKEAGRLQKAYRELMLGLGLKLDIAQLEGGDELAVLREMERAILRRIQREGRTFKLVQALTDTRLEIAAVQEERAQDAADRSRQSWEDTMSALELRLDAAQATKSLQDDLTALQAIERAILKRIQAEGKTTQLLRDLQDAREQQADIRKQIADRQRADRQADLFEMIGLTREGGEKTPGSGSLLKRARNLQEQIKGTVLDTPKTRQQLAGIVKALTDRFRKAGKDVRQAILGMLNDITSALEGDGGSKGTQITPGGIRPLQRLIAGLGLTEQQIEQFERNMQRRRSGRPINAFGFDFDGPTSGISGFPGMGDFSPTINVTVEIDGKKVTGVVTQQMQKTGKRRTNRRGGAGAGRGSIL